MTTVLVLGAGMVGTCTAVHLAQRGHQVVLVDRREPGAETSYGNAGIIQCEAVEPHPFPRDLGTLLRAAWQRDNAIHYHANALPQLAGPLFRYWANSGPRAYPGIARAYASLIAHAIPEHALLIEQAGADDLISRQGYGFVFRHPHTWRAGVARAQRLADTYGVRYTALDPEGLAAAEPALTRRLAGGILWLDPWAVRNPGELVGRYVRLLQRLGGVVAQGDATTLRQIGAGWQVDTVAGPVQAEHAVVALGPWSEALLRPLGYRMPLFIKRGYHTHYRSQQPPARPLLDADHGLVIVPMQQGVRITTGAEFAKLDAPATPVQMARSRQLAGQLVALDGAVEPQPWLGARPCTADMLPVIGPAPQHRGLWLNLGHAHQGFTLGPASGRLLADLLEGDTPRLDPKPYLPARFAGHG